MWEFNHQKTFSCQIPSWSWLQRTILAYLWWLSRGWQSGDMKTQLYQPNIRQPWQIMLVLHRDSTGLPSYLSSGECSFQSSSSHEYWALASILHSKHVGDYLGNTTCSDHLVHHWLLSNLQQCILTLILQGFFIFFMESPCTHVFNKYLNAS